MAVKIISGGQTGVDRAALDVALQLKLPIGGWCPKGRRAEDGPLPVRYPLRETTSPDYAQRTEWNVRDSHGTLVLSRATPSGGTAQTLTIAQRLRRPCLVLDLAQRPRPEAVQRWMKAHDIKKLNVAGPRESKSPGIYQEAVEFLLAALLPYGVKQALRRRKSA